MVMVTTTMTRTLMRVLRTRVLMEAGKRSGSV